MGSRRAIWNIMLLMVIYSLSRLFFFFINSDLYPEVSAAHLWEMMLGGMRFDLTAVLYLSSVYLVLALLPLPPSVRNHHVYQTVTRLFCLIPNAIGILVNCVDMVYVRFTDRRTTCTFFTEFRHDTNLVAILWQSLWQYWYVTLFALAAIALLIFCSAKSRPVHYPALPRRFVQRPTLNAQRLGEGTRNYSTTSTRRCSFASLPTSRSSVSAEASGATHAPSPSPTLCSTQTARKRLPSFSIRLSP